MLDGLQKGQAAFRKAKWNNLDKTWTEWGRKWLPLPKIPDVAFLHSQGGHQGYHRSCHNKGCCHQDCHRIPRTRRESLNVRKNDDNWAHNLVFLYLRWLYCAYRQVGEWPRTPSESAEVISPCLNANRNIEDFECKQTTEPKILHFYIQVDHVRGLSKSYPSHLYSL